MRTPPEPFDPREFPNRFPNFREEFSVLRSAERRQAFLDRMFPEGRRRALFASADLDSRGKPVKYYRFMRQEILRPLLENGTVTSEDHWKPGDRIEARELWTFLTGYLEFVLNGRPHAFETPFRSFDSLCGALAESGGGRLSPEILASLEYGPILREISAALDVRFLCNAKSGWNNKFTPFLSLGTGGPAGPHSYRRYYYGGGCHVEFAIPREFTVPSLYGFENEKETFVREIRLEWVTRVFVNPETFERDVIANPEGPMFPYYAKRTGGQARTPFPDEEAIQDWRFGEPTEPYRPKGILTDFTSECARGLVTAIMAGGSIGKAASK